jgi:hypothetical protein
MCYFGEGEPILHVGRLGETALFVYLKFEEEGPNRRKGPRRRFDASEYVVWGGGIPLLSLDSMIWLAGPVPVRFGFS